MNKHLAAGLLALLLVFAAGCGKYADENKGGNSATTSGTQAAGGTTNSSTSNGNTSTSSSTSTANTGASNTSSAIPNPPPRKVYEKVTLGPLQKGQEAKVGPLTIKFEEFNVVDKAAGLPQTGGYVFLVVKMSVTNSGDEPYAVNVGDNFKMETPEAKKSNWNVQASATRTPRLEGTIAKGETKTGWMGYLVKKQAGNFKFTFTHMDWGEAHWLFAIQ